jgi:hypothetical protein
VGKRRKLWVFAAVLGFSVLFAGKSPAQNADKIVIPAGTKFRASLETPISSKISEVGDPISISLLEPIVVEDRYVLPRGTQITGRITQVTPASRSKRRAEIYALFNEIPTSYGSEAVFVSVASADDVLNDEKIKTDAEGKLKANSSKGKDLENAAKGASLGSIATTPVAIAAHSVGPAIAGPVVGAMAGILLSKGRDIRLPVGSVFRMKFDRDAVLPVSQFRLAPAKPVLSPAPESRPPGQ